MFSKELVIFGTLVNPLTYTTSVELAANMGEAYLDLEKLGIEVFALKQFEEAIQKLKAGAISKIMFEL